MDDATPDPPVEEKKNRRGSSSSSTRSAMGTVISMWLVGAHRTVINHLLRDPFVQVRLAGCPSRHATPPVESFRANVSVSEGVPGDTYGMARNATL